MSHNLKYVGKDMGSIFGGDCHHKSLHTGNHNISILEGDAWGERMGHEWGHLMTYPYKNTYILHTPGLNS